MGFLIYMLSVADSFKLLLLLGSLLAIAVWACAGCVYLNNIEYGDDDKDVKISRAIFFKSLKIAIVAAFLCVVIPDSKTLAAMYLVPKIVENESVQQMTGKVGDVLNMKLNSWIDELNLKNEK